MKLSRGKSLTLDYTLRLNTSRKNTCIRILVDQVGESILALKVRVGDIVASNVKKRQGNTEEPKDKVKTLSEMNLYGVSQFSRYNREERKSEVRNEV